MICAIPQRVNGSPEVLLREHHGRTRVDGQSQSVVQIHVVQPVVVHLQSGGKGSKD